MKDKHDKLIWESMYSSLPQIPFQGRVKTDMVCASVPIDHGYHEDQERFTDEDGNDIFPEEMGEKVLAIADAWAQDTRGAGDPEVSPGPVEGELVDIIPAVRRRELYGSLVDGYKTTYTIRWKPKGYPIDDYTEGEVNEKWINDWIDYSPSGITTAGVRRLR